MKTMNMKYFFYLAALSALTVACSSDDVEPKAEKADGLVPIELSYTTLEAVPSRGSASQTLNNTYLESGKQITVRVSPANLGVYTDYVYTSGAGGVLVKPANAPFYPLDGSELDIFAYYPHDADATFSVQTDQTDDAKYLLSDLMTSNNVEDQGLTYSTVPLQFTHRMAKINVNVTAGVGVSQIISATLKSVKPTVTFSKGDFAVTLKNDVAATDIAVISGGTAATASGAALIPEQEKSGALLQIVTDQGTATYSLASAKTFEEGHVYTLNITVNRPEVGATTEITGWDASGSTVTINPTQCLTFNYGGVIFNMMVVKGGETLENYASTGNSPASGTSLKITNTYYMGQTEVTNGLWNAVMGSKPASQKNDGDSYPVAQVSWLEVCGGTYESTTVAEANSFLYKLNHNSSIRAQLTAYGLGSANFKLPTEGQWEYAARGGKNSPTYTYAGSNTIGDVAWYTDNSSATTHVVGTKAANALGLYDMSGNVWEWCSDWYGSLTSGTTLTDPTGAGSGSSRVIRGGSWYYAAGYCAVSFRSGSTPSYRSDLLGFRLALE